MGLLKDAFLEGWNKGKQKFELPYTNLAYENIKYDLAEMSGHEFEHFCADILKNNGFVDVSVTPASGDQGVDILAEKEGLQYAIQCKKYSTPLGNKAVQEVIAGREYYGCDIGVVLTNATFTQSAIKLASATNILLWDEHELLELISKSEKVNDISYAEYDDVKVEIDKSVEIENFENFLECDNDSLNSDESICILDETKSKRPVMRVLSKICFGWSVICVLTGEFLLIGEALFFVVLGLMFRLLSQTERKTKYINFLGKDIRKYIFVILSIVIACIPFIISIELVN